MTTSTSRRAVNSAVTIAAAVTVVVAVGADLLAGSHSAHVALVGVIAIALGVVRARLAGRHRCKGARATLGPVHEAKDHGGRVAEGHA